MFAALDFEVGFHVLFAGLTFQVRFLILFAALDFEVGFDILFAALVLMFGPPSSLLLFPLFLYSIPFFKISVSLSSEKKPCLINAYILTYLLTYSKVQSPLQANCFATSQEIPHILWNLKVHYRIHKLPPLVPILG